MNSSKPTYFQRKLILTGVVIGVIAFLLRLYIIFSQELVPGLNGGYYPLQVRAILETGQLAFPDMPLLFYLDAGLVKLISFFGFAVSDQLILFVVKLVDSLIVPLYLIPIIRMARLNHVRWSTWFSVAIFGYAVFSSSPWTFTGGFQKNELAILFLFLSVSEMLAYLKANKQRGVYWSLFWLLLTALTHFGTFSAALFLTLVLLIHRYRRSALIPAVIISLIGAGVIFWFDEVRFMRLMTAAFNMFGGRLSLFPSPSSIPSFALSVVFILWGVRLLKQKSLGRNERSILFTSIVAMILFSFPIMDMDYSRRLNLFLFLVHIVFLLHIYSPDKTKRYRILGGVFLLLTITGTFSFFLRNEHESIGAGGLKELSNLKPFVTENENTMIVTRHGLEWWAAWTLHTKVGQEQAVPEVKYDTYDKVLFLHENRKEDRRPEHGPFKNPELPEDGTVCLYASDRYLLYEYVN